MSVLSVESRSQQAWISPNNIEFIGAVLFAGYCGAFAMKVGWVPLLDGANLLFHEAGHPFYSIFGGRVTVYGGTLGQLTFPVVGAVVFWLRREAISFAIMILWFCENLWNIARYLADARIQLLPLVGNGEHDWTEILSRWGLLTKEIQIANGIRAVAWFGVAGTLIWLDLRRREGIMKPGPVNQQ